MKKLRTIPILLLVLLASCSKQDTEAPTQGFQSEALTEQAAEPTLLTGEEINRRIYEIIEKKGEFNWKMADDQLLWSAVVLGDGILTIGYGDTPFREHRSTKPQEKKERLMGIVKSVELASLDATQKSQRRLLIHDDEILNYIDIQITHFKTLKALRNEPDIRYLEPSGYRFFDYEVLAKSSSGCDTAPADVNPGDYTTVPPGSQVSWTFYMHNIPAAWNHSTGSGITVGVVDTGVSSEQSLLGSNFNQGFSAGRFIQKFGTFVNSIWTWATTTDGPNDQCGHGTLMAATIASPRNSLGLPVGVAYGSNLVSYRATSDVVLNGFHEQRGVENAIKALANRTDVRIISLSIGHIFSVGRISDAIVLAHSRGKMIFAAGGTSFPLTNWVGVIFPASMNETIAVTGIVEGAGYTECDVCHKGAKIDFTVVMQRANDNSRRSVCLGFSEGSNTYVGGSSVATATTAGIAALVWAKYPNFTREQVLERMKQAASLYPNRSANFGWGNIDALAAVQ